MKAFCLWPLITILASSGSALAQDASGSTAPELGYKIPAFSLSADTADRAETATESTSADESAFSSTTLSSDTSDTSTNAIFAEQASTAASANFANSAETAGRADQTNFANRAARSQNSDLLNNRTESFFRDASNLNSGTLGNSRLAADLGNRSISFAREINNANSIGGRDSDYLLNAERFSEGELDSERFSGSYNIDIEGNANSALQAENANTADRADEAETGGSGGGVSVVPVGSPIVRELEVGVNGPLKRSFTINIPSSAEGLIVNSGCLSTGDGLVRPSVPSNITIINPIGLYAYPPESYPFAKVSISFNGALREELVQCANGIGLGLQTGNIGPNVDPGYERDETSQFYTVPSTASQLTVELEAWGSLLPDGDDNFRDGIDTKSIARAMFQWVR